MTKKIDKELYDELLQKYIEVERENARLREQLLNQKPQYAPAIDPNLIGYRDPYTHGDWIGIGKKPVYDPPCWPGDSFWVNKKRSADPGFYQTFSSEGEEKCQS